MIMTSRPLDAPKPLIVVCGKYGSGKTTAARALQRELDGFHYIGIDDTRQKLGLIPYNRDDNSRILNQMDTWAMESLESGSGVIVDRPHQTYYSRARSYDVAIAAGAPLILVECVCPPDVARSRISARPPSDERTHRPANDPSILERIERNWEDVVLDFEKNPGLVRLLGFVRFFSHIPKVIPVNVPHEVIGVVAGICKTLEHIVVEEGQTVPR